MKKILLTGLFGAFFAFSCTSQKAGQESTQAQTPSVYKLKGDWQITSVDYDKNFKFKPFHEGADAQCFVGSTWRLIPNNNSGAYNLNGGGNCPTLTQPIKFEVTKDNDFKFKKLQADVKAKSVIEGYILRLENHQQDSFTLVQDVPFEGQILKVSYQIKRISTTT